MEIIPSTFPTVYSPVTRAHIHIHSPLYSHSRESPFRCIHLNVLNLLSSPSVFDFAAPIGIPFSGHMKGGVLNMMRRKRAEKQKGAWRSEREDGGEGKGNGGR